MREDRIKRNKKQQAKKSRWKLGTIVIAGIILLVGVYVAFTHTINSITPQKPEDAIGDFNLVSNNWSLDNGKVVILFIGAEACPFCAAESWSIVNALNQFGTWNGLSHVISNATDSIPSVPGWAFANASLSSNQIEFVEVETTTTSWDQKLQSMNSTESQLYQKYDPNGSIPFLLIGGMYLHLGSAVVPNQISNMDWSQCYNLSQSNSSFHDQIVNEANNISQVVKYVMDKNSPSMVKNQFSLYGTVILVLATDLGKVR